MTVSQGLLTQSGNSAARVAPDTSGDVIDARYRVAGTLGKGGMAVVYEVFDTATGQRRALKRLTPPDAPEKRMDAVAFFEREFFTLAQLRHPRIVSVYDYGVDAVGPFYTMELLDGGDLQRRAPVPWREACGFGRDVCSALALVHSRRMVYRDLSPRNVRCTSDGLAKLIDFGAMGPVGPAKELIGTIPCSAREALDLRSLDGRTDLSPSAQRSTTRSSAGTPSPRGISSSSSRCGASARGGPRSSSRESPRRSTAWSSAWSSI